MWTSTAIRNPHRRPALRLGRVSAGAAARTGALRDGLPLASFAAGRGTAKETAALVRRLAESGLVEYRLVRGRQDQAVIEPQVADYWPRIGKLRDTDTLVLSRFAYLRRRASELVLESPRAGALFRIDDARIAAGLALLAMPRQVKWLRRQAAFLGRELLALMLDARILFRVDARDQGVRATEGDGSLVMWDDLVFHARSAEGRHAVRSGASIRVETVAELPRCGPGGRDRGSICAISCRRMRRSTWPSCCGNVGQLRDFDAARQSRCASCRA